MSWDPHAGSPPGVPVLAPRSAGAAAWIVLAVALLAPAAIGLGLHNQLVSRQEAVDGSWAQVESAYQRRADLVPALVELLNRHMRHESETLQAVVRARGEAAMRMAGRAPADAAEIERLARVEAELGAGLHRLVALAEDHPTLRSADAFLQLQAQLEGAENRVHVARMAFNDSVRAYNAAIQKLPGAWIARARGLERRPYFESQDGAEHASPLALD